MFRDGQYLEVIKASDNCLATAVVTVQEKTIEIKRKKVATNKWLDLEDWAALYKILKRALLRNSQNSGQSTIEGCEWRKSTRQLEVTYTFEPPDSSKGTGASLPTIRVNVSPARKKAKRDTESSHSRSSDNAEHEVAKKKSDCVNGSERSSKRDKADRSHKASLEEYVPDAFPSVKKLCTELMYVPSKKSALESMHVPSNEYTPMIADSKASDVDPIPYVPNSLPTSCTTPYETYEPRPTGVVNVDVSEVYVPNSKGPNVLIEEYQPDFTSKLMKFDDSYVPSKTTSRSVGAGSKKSADKSQRHELRRKPVLTSKERTRLFS